MLNLGFCISNAIISQLQIFGQINEGEIKSLMLIFIVFLRVMKHLSRHVFHSNRQHEQNEIVSNLVCNTHADSLMQSDPTKNRFHT